MISQGVFYVVLSVICVNIALCYAAGDGDETKELECNAYNASCGDCAQHTECYWCTNDETCHYYGWSSIKTYFKHCSWGQARWKYCWLNVEAMVICLSVLGGVMLIMMCCCCCWCRNKCNKRRRRRMMHEQTEMDQQAEERRERQQIRSEERRSRMDQIRDKYGLNSNAQAEGPPYDRLDR